jgi:heat shock protein 5
LIGGSSRIPKIRQLITEYFGKEPVEGIDPEEAVTQGAAIQGNILTTDDDGMVCTLYLTDVCPLTLGVEASGGAVHQFITRNQVVPARTSKNFSTVIDNQSTALIRIFEGERAMSQDNALLGELVLADIAPAPRGIPQIQVTIDVDALGDMKISAVTEGT